MARRIPVLLTTGALLLVACGGGGSSSSSSTTTASRKGAVSKLSDVKSAVVQIVAKGTFAQPAGSLAAYEELEEAGSGSGFIIDPSGLAVTNNHVVTGAATLKVMVGGSDEELSAKVLGVSECSDMALIDIEGDGFPFLDWYRGPIEPGLEVRAAGFPLGDPEFTLTSGIVSKAKTGGDTEWASVDSVIEHDANIQPGNSGGPLVDVETAKVVGVNYAGGDPGTGTSQFFAISAKQAEGMATKLRKGDVLALGVNGQAVVDEEAQVAGIWVASVDTNSPAGELDLKGGDIIERVEGLSVGADGTLKDYCDILETHEPTDKLAVQVLRFADSNRLRGEFNGDALAEIETFGDLEEDAGTDLADDGQAYTDYVAVSDESGQVSVEVPSAWAQNDGSALELDDGTSLPQVAAAPNLEQFRNTWTEPGVFVVAGDADVGEDLGALLDDVAGEAAQECPESSREAYDDQLYQGLVQYYSGCGSSLVVAIAAQPAEKDFTVVVVVQLASQDDIEALKHIVETFRVTLD